MRFEDGGINFTGLNFSDVLQLEMNEITLSATNTPACTVAVIQAECESTTNFTVELNWNDYSDPSYSVNFQQHNLSITCQQQLAATGCPTCVETGGIGPVTPTGTHTTYCTVSLLYMIALYYSKH